MGYRPQALCLCSDEGWEFACARELLSRTRFEALEVARATITQWIDNFCNSQRWHTTIGNTNSIKHKIALADASVEDTSVEAHRQPVHESGAN